MKKQSHDTARLYGLGDRGTIEVGAVADLNLIDYDNLQMGNPTVVNDLPAGGARLLQDAIGLRGDDQVRGDHLRRRQGHRCPPGRTAPRGPLMASPLRPAVTA